VQLHGDLLSPDRNTIAHVFRAAGYRTSWVGMARIARGSTLSTKEKEYIQAAIATGNNTFVLLLILNNFAKFFLRLIFYM